MFSSDETPFFGPKRNTTPRCVGRKGTQDIGTITITIIIIIVLEILKRTGLIMIMNSDAESTPVELRGSLSLSLEWFGPSGGQLSRSSSAAAAARECPQTRLQCCPFPKPASSGSGGAVTGQTEPLLNDGRTNGAGCFRNLYDMRG
ncbi:hypothetical protein ZHAS_00016991 [Anopheles sinensis]|uniref:Uncharacterized protein n=1 Tax=Anopheles sinensis TaxID=74873 RepID=A0A084WFJ2_ANOSI|nr:hypothetical protein ZHAS_00016991 [Anopheles sinensis]